MGAGSSKPEDASKHVFSRSVHFVPIRQPNSILVLNGAPTSIPTTPYRHVKEPYTDLPNPLQWHTCPVLQRTSRIPPSKLRSNTTHLPPKLPSPSFQPPLTHPRQTLPVRKPSNYTSPSASPRSSKRSRSARPRPWKLSAPNSRPKILNQIPNPQPQR